MNRIVLIFAILLAVLLPFVSAIEGSVYSIDSDHVGIAANKPEGYVYSSRDTLAYQQPVSMDAESDIYSLRLGWFEELVEEVTSAEVSVGTGGGQRTIRFDVDILEFESPIGLGDFFDFTYFIKGVGNINDDVNIDFWIEKNDEIITSGSTVIYMGSDEGKNGTASLFLPSNIESGQYKFVIKVYYETASAESHRTIEISVDVEEGVAVIKSLFDISFFLYDTVVLSSDELIAITNLENFGDVSETVKLTFIIEDLNGNKLYRAVDEIFVQTEEIFRKEFKGLNLNEGEYILILETFYGEDVYDEFRSNFIIEVPQEEVDFLIWGAIGFIFIFMIVIFIYLIVHRCRPKKDECKKVRRVKRVKKVRPTRRFKFFKRAIPSKSRKRKKGKILTDREHFRSKILKIKGKRDLE